MKRLIIFIMSSLRSLASSAAGKWCGKRILKEEEEEEEEEGRRRRRRGRGDGVVEEEEDGKWIRSIVHSPQPEVKTN